MWLDLEVSRLVAIRQKHSDMTESVILANGRRFRANRKRKRIEGLPFSLVVAHEFEILKKKI